MASKQWIAVGCIVGALALGAAAMVRFGSEAGRVEVGAKAPDFHVYDLAAGDSLKIREHYKGTVTLVNIWATWCVPCKVEMPALERAYDSLGPSGFKIAAVSIDVDGPESVRKFTDEMHLTFDILQDRSGRIQEAYQTTGVPESFLLDRSGTHRAAGHRGSRMGFAAQPRADPPPAPGLDAVGFPTMPSRLLAIETSCDETSAAILTSTGGEARLDSVVILSQDVHAIFGGVVPELASRAHLRTIGPVVDRALAEAGISLNQVDAFAVTAGPGLVGALLVGVMYAKTLAWSLGRPLLGVHHLEGHLFAPTLEDTAFRPPFVGLLVSGGHTMLLDVPAWGDYRLLGETRDDAAGEAFDKVATLLGLGYPGGPLIEKLAPSGRAGRFRFPPADAARRRAARARPVRLLLQRAEDGGAPGGQGQQRPRSRPGGPGPRVPGRGARSAGGEDGARHRIAGLSDGDDRRRRRLQPRPSPRDSASGWRDRPGLPWPRIA